MTTYPRTRIPCKDLMLGDIVQVFEGEWGTAIIKQIKDDCITFYRPYATHDGVSYTGGVICLMGLEVFSCPINDTSYYVYRRHGELR
jgi:hypothetical protein